MFNQVLPIINGTYIKFTFNYYYASIYMEHIVHYHRKQTLIYQNHMDTYDFLDILIPYLDVTNYYTILQKYQAHQIINIYDFIRVRVNIIDQLIDTNVGTLNKMVHMTTEIFNDTIKSFIHDHKALAIFVINAIQHYDTIP